MLVLAVLFVRLSDTLCDACVLFCVNKFELVEMLWLIDLLSDAVELLFEAVLSVFVLFALSVEVEAVLVELVVLLSADLLTLVLSLAESDVLPAFSFVLDVLLDVLLALSFVLVLSLVESAVLL